jgi:RimJ/RimL family protein N-acetyltransferase
MTLSDGVVVLRPATATDAAAIVAGRDDVSGRFLGEGDADPRPVFVIVVDEVVVGWVDHDTDREWLEPGQVNVGYHLSADHRGRGYATRAVRLLLQHLAAEGREATFLIHPENDRSLALVERLGIPRARDLDGQRCFAGPLYGRWEALDVVDLRHVMDGATFRWWVAGGVALELHVGGSWRDHSDLDIGLCRTDAPALHAQLDPWPAWVAAGGCLRRWDGRPLAEAADENNVWWRRERNGPWVLDTAIGSGTQDEWIYRRDPSIRRPWSEAVLTATDGIPYLAPELQLLFKAKDVRPKDQLDAEVVIPRLAPERRRALRGFLPPDHPWQALAAA